MFERFTDSARSVVTLAECEARELGADDIGAEHLLLALTAAEAATSAQVLLDAGVSQDALRSALVARASSGPFDEEDAAALTSVGIDLALVLSMLGPDAEPPATRRANGRRGRLRFSPAAKKTLQLAVREAIWLKSGAIGSEHLLLGLLRCGDPTVTSLLGSLGVDPEQLRPAVLARLGTAA